MKIPILIFALSVLIIFLLVLAGCKNIPIESSDNAKPDTSKVVVYKPNIYLYPKTTSSLLVKLIFPLGGNIIKSIPFYGDGWVIEVEPSGKINKQYDFLFYESQTPNAYQYNSGWVISRDTLSSFFSINLLNAGFSQREINDFIEYWIPLLSDYSFYIIYPQFADDIGKVIQLNISEPPDNLLRLFYVIQGSNGNVPELIKPNIPKFVRSGFVVTEWGVVLR